MTSLRDRTVAEIERREQTARAANFGAEPESWTARPVMPPITTGERGNAEIRDSEGDLLAEVATVQDAEHIALHDPADALRRYTADRERLEEHHPCNDDDTDDPCGAHATRYECCPCHTPGPCLEQYRIAEALSIIGPDATGGQQP